MIDYETIVGPMMLIDATIRPVELSTDGCPRNECDRFMKGGSDEFCRKCGTEIMTITYEEERFISWNDFTRSLWNEDTEIDEEDDVMNTFMQPEYLDSGERFVLVSNTTSHNIHLEENDFRLLSDVDFSGKLRQFKDDNASYIQQIKDFFGEGNVTIEMGICRYTY
jgi:hypothetical protein